jgi:hypothetical protein
MSPRATNTKLRADYIVTAAGVLDCKPDDEIEVGDLTSSIQLIVLVFPIGAID